MNTPIVVLGFAILLASQGVSAADAERGQKLYQSRCDECHTESVHGREKRVAKDFDDVRRWVTRWSENVGARWGANEIDDVSSYLNDTYYHFPCPRDVCKVVSMR